MTAAIRLTGHIWRLRRRGTGRWFERVDPATAAPAVRAARAPREETPEQRLRKAQDAVDRHAASCRSCRRLRRVKRGELVLMECVPCAEHERLDAAERAARETVGA
jgi:hypothetical protein